MAVDTSRRPRPADALTAYGVAGLGTAAGYNRVSGAIDRTKVRRIDRKLAAATEHHERVKAAKPPRGDKEALARWKKEAGAAQAAGDTLRQARKVPVMTFGRKAALVAGGVGTGVPALWAGSRRRVQKDYRRRDYDKDFAAAVAGGAVPHAAAVASDKLDNHYDRKIKANPEHQARFNAHRAAHGNPKAPGDPRWNKLYSTYPTDLPGGRYRRVASRTLAGRGLLASTGVSAAGAVALRHKAANRKVEKAARPGVPTFTDDVRFLRRWAKDHRKAVAMPVGVGAAGAAAGKYEDRRAGSNDRNSARNAALGAAAGQGVYRGVGYGAKGLSNRQLRQAVQRGEWNRSQNNKAQRDARRAAGLKGNPTTPEEKFRMYRHTPPSVPGWRGTRLGGHLAGRRGWAINTGLTVGGSGAGLVASGRRDQVGKAAELGYRERNLNLRRTAETGLGLGLVAWGGPRLRMLSPMAAHGVRVAERHGRGKEAEAAVTLARDIARGMRNGTGRAAQQAKRVRQINAAVEAVPPSLRPGVATTVGAILAAHAQPIRQERFTPVRGNSVYGW